VIRSKIGLIRGEEALTRLF